MVIAGRGGSSYIDTVVLRDRDTNGGGGWTGASDGTLEARHYYAQNWRADVSGIFDHTGAVLEWVKYSAYGVPHLLTPGDHDKSGEVDKDDETAFNADYGTGNLRADLDEDGDVDTDDQALFVASFNKTTPGGRWKLSAEDVGNRKGYAGYEHEGFGNDLAAVEIAHVRHRVLHFGLGRWTRRDPLGYVDGMNEFAYVRAKPLKSSDPLGLVETNQSCAGACDLPPTHPMYSPEPSIQYCAGGMCDFELPIVPISKHRDPIYCVGNKCTSPPDQEAWPEWMQWLWNTFWVTVESANPVPTGALAMGPDIFSLALCRRVTEYELDHPDLNPITDPDYMLLWALCKLSRRTITMRRVCCQDTGGPITGPNNHGPPNPSNVTSLPCPSTWTDAQCCALASAYGTPYPVPAPPGASSCAGCGTSMTCTPRRWKAPVPPFTWPGILP